MLGYRPRGEGANGHTPTRPIPGQAPNTGSPLQVLSQLIDKVRTKLNGQKPTPVIVNRLAVLDKYEATSRQLKDDRARLLDTIRQKFTANKTADVSAEQRQLKRIDGQNARLQKAITTLEAQDDAINIQRESNEVLRAMGAGNNEIRALQEEIQNDADLDLDTINDDYEELIGDVVDRAGTLYNEISLPNGMDSLNDGMLTDSGSTVGESVSNEIEAMRKQVESEEQQRIDSDVLNIKSQLPSMSPSPTLSSAPVSQQNNRIRSGAGPVRTAPPAWQHVGSSGGNDDMAWLMGNNLNDKY